MTVDGLIKTFTLTGTATSAAAGASIALAVPAAIAIYSHCTGLYPPISNAQIAANAAGQAVIISYARCGNNYRITFPPYSLGPLAVPAPLAATVPAASWKPEAASPGTAEVHQQLSAISHQLTANSQQLTA